MRINLNKWLAAGRVAAVVAGAYVISSNHVNAEGVRPGCGGMGYVVNPDADVLGVTSAGRPFLTLDIDPGIAEAAKETYPRYVKEPSPESGCIALENGR